MALLDSLPLGNLADTLGVVTGIIPDVLDLVNGITNTVGDLTAGLGLPLPSLDLPLLGNILATDHSSVAVANDTYVESSDDFFYPTESSSEDERRQPADGFEAADSDSSVDAPKFKSASLSCDPEYYEATFIDTTLPAENSTLATVYRYRRQQSVNLGSWFMLEAWMTPSLFSCAQEPAVSELDVAKGWNGNAKLLLERHWDTFITEKDFEWLASVGINTVRLPLGYWHLGKEFTVGTAYEEVADVYEGALPRVVRAVGMAAKYNIGVLLDLHGAPGSQNGQHHSGVSDGQTLLFNNEHYISKTIDVLSFLTQTFVTVPNVVGIQILNEPNNVPELTEFYARALEHLRTVHPAAASFPYYIHDGFDLWRGVDFIASRDDWVVLDHHSYYVFTPSDMAKPASLHTSDIRGSIGEELMRAGQRLNQNIVIDEWSCALTDDSLRTEGDWQGAVRSFCDAQMEVYASVGGGWSFWSYKKEDCDSSWCFVGATGRSLPTTFFSFDRLQKLGEPGTASLDLATDPEIQSRDEAKVLRSRSETIQAIHRRLEQDVNLPPLGDILARIDRPDGAFPMGATDFDLFALPFSSATNHRFETIHQRRADRSSSSNSKPNKAGPTSANLEEVLDNIGIRTQENPSPLTPSQQTVQRAYSDGFLTAKLFAQAGPSYSLSRLGFKGQYLKDSVRTLRVGGLLSEEDEAAYREWFEKGLMEGEEVVDKVLVTMLG